MSDCLFCKIAAGDMQTDIVREEEDIVAFRDINPQAPTHILIIPRQHIPRVADTDANHQLLLGRLILAANEIAVQEGVAEKGYRLVLNNGDHGGQDVYHIHLHLLGGRQMSWPPG